MTTARVRVQLSSGLQSAASTGAAAVAVDRVIPLFAGLSQGGGWRELSSRPTARRQRRGSPTGVGIAGALAPALRVPPKNFPQMRVRDRILLQRQEVVQLVANQAAVQRAPLAHDNPFDVEPVLRPIGERFQHDEILG
jgi:hypothetical protein